MKLLPIITFIAFAVISSIFTIQVANNKETDLVTKMVNEDKSIKDSKNPTFPLKYFTGLKSQQIPTLLLNKRLFKRGSDHKKHRLHVSVNQMWVSSTESSTIDEAIRQRRWHQQRRKSMRRKSEHGSKSKLSNPKNKSSHEGKHKNLKHTNKNKRIDSRKINKHQTRTKVNKSKIDERESLRPRFQIDSAKKRHLMAQNLKREIAGRRKAHEIRHKMEQENRKKRYYSTDVTTEYSTDVTTEYSSIDRRTGKPRIGRYLKIAPSRYYRSK